jgi:hypothetical protein
VASETGVKIKQADWNQLQEALRDATDKYRSSTDPGVQREAWVIALRGICNFLREYNDGGIGPAVMITELLGDLSDIHEGRCPARLKPAEGKPKRTTPDNAIADLATAAAMIDFLIDAGDSKDAAARQIAKLATDLGRALPKSQHRGKRRDNAQATPGHVRLLNWRTQLKRSKKGHPSYQLARELYDFWRRHRDDYMKTHKANFREAAEAMIGTWTDMIKPKKV